MLSFIISKFRGRINLEEIPDCASRLRKEISRFSANAYLNTVQRFFGLKDWTSAWFIFIFPSVVTISDPMFIYY